MAKVAARVEGHAYPRFRSGVSAPPATIVSQVPVKRIAATADRRGINEAPVTAIRHGCCRAQTAPFLPNGPRHTTNRTVTVPAESAGAETIPDSLHAPTVIRRREGALPRIR